MSRPPPRSASPLTSWPSSSPPRTSFPSSSTVSPSPHSLFPPAPRPPSSFSALTRRHLSKLSMSSPRESDADSVLSEPVSYSTSSYVAADMWLVHKDVDSAERGVVGRMKGKELGIMDPVEGGGSSRLVRLFFSGAGGGVVSGKVRRRYDGDRMEGVREKEIIEEAVKREDAFGGYKKKRRFERIRRWRWWLRRVAWRFGREQE